jgi:hypothetical protein
MVRWDAAVFGGVRTLGARQIAPASLPGNQVRLPLSGPDQILATVACEIGVPSLASAAASSKD